jgi:hypothetical protein
MTIGALAETANTTDSNHPPKAEENARKQPVPAAPDGFVWRGMKNIIFLRPSEWHEQSIVQNIGPVPATLYASSPEMFGINQPFETGFTLRVADNIQKTAKMQASKFALAMLSPIFQSHQKADLLLFNQNKQDGFDLIYFRYRDAPKGMTPIIVHKFVMSNDAMDRSFEATFESPESTWNANWEKFGTPLIGKLLITGESQ